MYVQLSISAPGKVILFGEHTVVSGSNCLVSTIDRRVYLEYCSYDVNNEPCMDKLGIFLSGTHVFNVYISDGEIKYEVLVDSSINHTMAKIMIAILIEVGNETFPCGRIMVESHIPMGMGMGSSAALSVCLAGCFLHLSGVDVANNTERVDEVAICGERICHGNPSGVDNKIIARGGTFVYNKVRRTCEPVGIPQSGKFIVIDTQKEHCTSEIVAKVQARIRHTPTLMGFNHIIDEVITQFIDGKIAIDTAFEICDGILYSLGVHHSTNVHLMSVCKKNGIPVKVTGAGDGGVMLCPFDEVFIAVFNENSIPYTVVKLSDKNIGLEVIDSS
ncbi:hypothetical protein PCE1_003993 [Barthelona sp. PCE]